MSHPSRFVPIHVDSLDATALGMNLYIRHSKHEQPTLYRGVGLEFTEEDRGRLRERGVEFLYISEGDHREYRAVLRKKLGELLTDSNVPMVERANQIRASCSRMIEDVMLFPDSKEAMSQVAEISHSFTQWSEQCPGEFSYLLDMSAHDFYTATHMVNVGVGCGLLAKEVNHGDAKTLQLIIQGGLLHDVGKRDVPDAILNKEGKLEDHEWKQISKHPELGFEILSKNKDLSDVVLDMTRNHHERIDGKGYPRGLEKHLLTEPARICAIVDVYDAITATRPYRGPMPPQKALELMSEGRGTQFDAELFDTWAKLVTRLVEADPSRAVAPTTPVPTITLGELQPTSKAAFDAMIAERLEVVAGSINDRRWQRTVCNFRVALWRHDLQKPDDHPEKDRQEGRILDFSQGGLCLEVPMSVEAGDHLWVEFLHQKKMIRRCVEIRRVTKNPKGLWSVGGQFMTPGEAQELPDAA